MTRAMFLVLFSVACAQPGYDPLVAGEVVVPDALAPAARVQVEMRDAAGVLLDAQMGPATDLTFEFPLDSGEVTLVARIDLTGDGPTADDLASPAVTAMQGDLHVRLYAAPQ